MAITKDEQLTQRRREILDAARTVFDASGYDATTMDAVALKAGISKGSIYNYFPSKQDLFKQVFLEDQIIQDYQAVLASPAPARQMLDKLLDLWFAQLNQHMQANRLVLEYWATAAREGREGEMHATFQRLYQQWRDITTNLINRGMASGEFAGNLDPAMMAALVLGLVDGVNSEAMLNVVRVDEKFLAGMKAAIFAWLTSGQPTAPAPATIVNEPAARMKASDL
jgi:TetR/AcrR family transcriptional regulator, transcriptional repressor of aconitase